jgi:Trk-type K+ transport system membrane component
MTHPRLIEMRRRIARIRRLVAVCAVAAFIVLFSTIYVQMATGHDSVLATTTATASATSTTGSSTDSSTTDSSGSDSEPSAVTTAQS